MRLFIIFSLLFLGFTGDTLAQVSPDSVAVSKDLSQSANKIDLHLNLSAGETYSYTTDYNQYIVQEIMGSSIEIRQQMTTDYRYQIESNDGDEIKIKATYERLQMQFEAPQGDFVFDSNNPQMDDKFTKLNSMIDKPFYIYMNSEGKVTKVEGYDQIIAGLELDDNIKELLTDSALMNSVEMNIYAPHPVSMGDSWNKIRSYALGKLQLNSDLTYTLEGMSEDLAWLNVSGQISAIGTEEAYEMEFSGTQSGTLETDINTGMISHGNINMDIDAVIKSQGFEVPMKMNTTIRMSGTKL